MTVQVAIDLALDRLFTYEVPESLEKKLAVGQLLSVPFGHRDAHGFALTVSTVPPPPILSKKGKPIPLKAVCAIVDETPFFSPALLQLVKKVAVYTAAPLELVLKTALPSAVLKKNIHPRELLYIEPALAALPVALTEKQQWLYDQIVRLGGGWMSSLCKELGTTSVTLRTLGQKGLVSVAVRTRRRDPLGGKRILPTKPLALNAEQAAALAEICAPAKTPVLLFGVTGSGKTEVYLQAIARELAEGRGAIVMVPEIALTPQTLQRFASRFGERVAVLHSALSDGERYDEWHRIRSGAAQVVVGPRSAVWAPVRNLGLIVVDEEHETSYKQDEMPRYHARDVAVLRGALEGARVVLGSATPSLESWQNVQSGKYRLAVMRKRAGAGSLPHVVLVDMNPTTQGGDAAPDAGGAIFSKALLDAIGLRLRSGEQTMLFLNRRGFSRSYACASCGAVMTCPACDLPYTYHRADRCLRCHVCGGWRELPTVCETCHGTAFSFNGIGTQRAEAALAKCFPKARVLRMDADSTARKHSHDDILRAFGCGEADILIGTQMIAKGLDFRNVTLVGVLNADSSLNLAGSDFRAAERTFQLLAQVSGRAGRADLPGEVIIQTRDPTLDVMRLSARADFETFAARELAERRTAFLPPFCHLAVISLFSEDLNLVDAWASLYAKSLAAYARKAEGPFVVSEAMPSALEKIGGRFRWQIVVRASRASAILSGWRWITAVRPVPNNLTCHLDLDALNLV